MTPQEQWARIAALAMEGFKLAVLVLAGFVSFLVGLAPRGEQEKYMDYAVIAGVLTLAAIIGSLAIVLYGIYRMRQQKQ